MIAQQQEPQQHATAQERGSLHLATDVVTYAWAAVQFLTRLPTPALAWQENTLAKAMLFFPAVGLALGAADGALYLWLSRHLNHPVAAVLALAALIALTGGLHEDGLADCADAFGSRHSRPRTLEILRDSRIGSFGAIALVLSLAGRVLLLSSLPDGRVLAWVASSAMLSRWAMLPLTWLPAARVESGLGRQVAQNTPWSVLAIATVSTVATVAVLLGGSGLAPLLFTVLTTALCAGFYKRRLGGVTGDCFGATAQLVEIAVLLCGAWIR